MRTAWLLAVALWVGCAPRHVYKTVRPATEVPTWAIILNHGDSIEYPDHAWASDMEGDVAVDLSLDQGKVIGAETVSGESELRAAVLKATTSWQFEPVTLTSLHRVIRFKKSPTLADFKEHGTIVVTRGLEPPLLIGGEPGRIIAAAARGIPESSWNARLRCAWTQMASSIR